MCGANTVMLPGALLRSCWGGVKKLDGFTLGAGNCEGNPPDTVLVMSGEFTQPEVMLVNGNVVVQL